MFDPPATEVGFSFEKINESQSFYRGKAWRISAVWTEGSVEKLNDLRLCRCMVGSYPGTSNFSSVMRLGT